MNTPNLTQRGEYNAQPSKGYPDIPDAAEFQNQGYGYETPAVVHGWQWSDTFGRWSALVTFANGWRGFTWPKRIGGGS